MEKKKNILISSNGSSIAKILSNCLVSHNTNFINDKDLIYSNPKELEKLFEKIDVYVHIGFKGFSAKDEMELIDYHTRITYDLLFAAGKKNVKKVISISTLELYKDYEANLTVSENWETKFPLDQPELLCANLSEKVCKEFARDQVFEVINLRLGDLRENSDTRLSEEKFKKSINLMVDLDFSSEELKQTKNPFNSARKKGPNWINLHLQDTFEGQKFLTNKIDNLIGV